MNNYLHTTFESSSTKTPQFMSFAKAYKREVVRLLGDNFELASWNTGHFYISAFFKNKSTRKYVYISCSDVRFFPNEWHNHILIRTAKDNKDYTGGMNCFCELDMLSATAKYLTALTEEESKRNNI